jgi:CrcB protein
MTYLLIALGGAVGAVSRYMVSVWVQNRVTTTFPWGIFIVNAVGCLLMGLLFPILTARLSPPVRMMILVGFLGALTTWSTFGHDTIQMASRGQFAHAAGYVVLTNVVCLASVWIGYRIASQAMA